MNQTTCHLINQKPKNENMLYKELEEKMTNGSATADDIREIIELIDSGNIRVAEKVDGDWVVHTWVKNAVLKYFGITSMSDSSVGDFHFRDKIPLKKRFENVRVVPGGNSVRYGSYLAESVVMMPPSYVNIGAYVGTGTMIDSHVLVGSCAQIGAGVHLSAGVQIGGVLEPANAMPVIIEDGAFIGAGVLVVEGFVVRSGAVLAPGVVLSSGTKVLETDADGKIIASHEKEIPANAIVVPGARQRGEVMLQTPIIIGYKNEGTSAKTGLTDFLRDF